MKKNTKLMLSVLSFAAVALAGVCASAAVEAKAPQPVPVQWQGLKVGVLGDSITNPQYGDMLYWRRLSRWLGWQANAYAKSGHSWKDIPGQIDRMEKEMGDEIDAIFIFIGTNDYGAARPLGQWYDETEGTVNWWGKEHKLKHRVLSRDAKTLRGLINLSLERLKKRYPDSQIVLLTPTKRGIFHHPPACVSPAEDWPNTLGLHLEDYVRCVREAGQVWSCPVIDLYGESGFLPSVESTAKYVRSKDCDWLHPNGLAHERIARLIYHRLSALPGTFRDCTGK